MLSLAYVGIGESVSLLQNRAILAYVDEETLIGKDHVDIVGLNVMLRSRALAHNGQFHLATSV